MQSEDFKSRITSFGHLKYGNPSGDFTKAPRCGAKTRRGTSCLAPAMANGRCRMHGGKSTGPRTLIGREKIGKQHFKHGLYSIEYLHERSEFKKLMRKYKDTLKKLL